MNKVLLKLFIVLSLALPSLPAHRMEWQRLYNLPDTSFPPVDTQNIAMVCYSRLKSFERYRATLKNNTIVKADCIANTSSEKQYMCTYESNNSITHKIRDQNCEKIFVQLSNHFRRIKHDQNQTDTHNT